MTNESSMSEKRSDLSAAKRALLAQRLRGKRKKTLSVDQTIPKRPSAPYTSLSFTQQRLWFLAPVRSG